MTGTPAADLKPLKWRRVEFGYLSTDGEWFIERGGMMSHGNHAWLAFRKARSEEVAYTERGSAFAPNPGESLYDLDGVFYLYRFEDGWLSSVKAIVEQWRAQGKS